MSIGIKLEMSSEYQSENSNQIMTRRDQVKFSVGIQIQVENISGHQFKWRFQGGVVSSVFMIH